MRVLMRTVDWIISAKDATIAQVERYITGGVAA
jgi:hypothetical protein